MNTEININGWSSMEHWNDRLVLELNERDIKRLSKFCAVVARDGRFRKAEGYAQIWRHGRDRELFSEQFTTTVVEAIQRAPERLKDFLRAARGVSKIEVVAPDSGTLEKMNLTNDQEVYASDLHGSLGRALGFPFVKHFDMGLFVTCHIIAQKRIPRPSK